MNIDIRITDTGLEYGEKTMTYRDAIETIEKLLGMPEADRLAITTEDALALLDDASETICQHIRDTGSLPSRSRTRLWDYLAEAMQDALGDYEAAKLDDALFGDGFPDCYPDGYRG